MKTYDLKNWKDLTKYQKDYICENQKLPSKFIQSVWKDLSNDQKNYICKYQKLSLDFIQSVWKDLTDYQKYHICEYQKLSLDFIQSVWKDLSNDQKTCICKYQKLSSKFILKNLSVKQKEIQKKKHSVKSLKQKTLEIKDYAARYKLKFQDGFLYAFRDHDEFGRGQWNGTLFYEQGKYYRDWHCDMDVSEENSFGLGIFPKGNTPVKVDVKDWGCEVSRHDGKCRVWGFTVIPKK